MTRRGGAVTTGIHTLAIDIGGTALKAVVLDGAGAVAGAREPRRVPTSYPCPPERLIDDLADLVGPLGRYDRISVGFPGVVREGRIRTAPAFVTVAGLGTERDTALIELWREFDLAAAVSDRLGAPCRVGNDADVHAAGAVDGVGLEVVLTLGTGVGSSVFRDGVLALHLELAHHPIVNDETYNSYLGEAARLRIDHTAWNERVNEIIGVVDALVCPDAILVGGGNSTRVTLTIGDEVESEVRLIDNEAGLLGGVRLWEPRSR